VGRTQEILYYIKRILKKNRLPELRAVPVYIDSPLGIEATKVYERCAKGYYDAEAREMAKDGSPFDFATLRVAKSTDESKAINNEHGCKIIISSSGMCDAGRIRHHLKHNLYRADCTVIFTGYQAQGTLGRALLNGVQKVKFFGEELRVNADIRRLDGFSGHAGMDELLEWVAAITPKPHKVILVHGETEALLTFSRALQDAGQDTLIPYLGDAYLLDSGRTRTAAPAPEAAAIETTARDYGIRKEVARIIELLDKNADRRSPDMPLKLSILEADVKAIVDKWEAIL
jgi:metallo-beta-lactamase family protein